ncbi:MAG: hypothetical protein AAF244_03480, partial [Pseudomonadota bacterium]
GVVAQKKKFVFDSDWRQDLPLDQVRDLKAKYSANTVFCLSVAPNTQIDSDILQNENVLIVDMRDLDMFCHASELLGEYCKALQFSVYGETLRTSEMKQVFEHLNSICQKRLGLKEFRPSPVA